MNMKLNFNFIMFLLITIIPFFLLELDNSKTQKAEFIISKEEVRVKDSLKIFEVIDGEEVEYFFRLNENNHNKAYFFKDSVFIDLTTPGAFGGYYLRIKLFKENYTSRLIKSDCTWYEELKIKEQFLQFEDFNLVHGGKLKGEYFCKAIPRNDFRVSAEQINIRGHFELDLVDIVEERKLFE